MFVLCPVAKAVPAAAESVINVSAEYVVVIAVAGKEFNKRTVIFKDNKTQESEVVFEDFDSDDLPTKNEKTPTLNNFIISVIQAIGVRKIREMIH